MKEDKEKTQKKGDASVQEWEERGFEIKNGVLLHYRGKDSEVVIPASVTSIGYGAFEGCYGLTAVTIPNSVSEIRSRAFEGCYGLTAIEIPDSVTSIGGFAFYHCGGLTLVTIPGSVIEIGSEAFFGCKSLERVTLGKGVTLIGDSAFFGCSGLKEIVIPNSVVKIGEGAFKNCSGLKSVTLENGVAEIGEEAFWGCEELNSIEIPKSVNEIGASAFKYTAYSAAKENWEGPVLYAGNRLIEAKNTIAGSYKIKEGTEMIAGGAFSGCNRLTKIEIPRSVTKIGDHAFEGCGLKCVFIPSSVTSIGTEVFLHCYDLVQIAVEAKSVEGWSQNWDLVNCTETEEFVDYQHPTKGSWKVRTCEKHAKVVFGSHK